MPQRIVLTTMLLWATSTLWLLEGKSHPHDAEPATAGAEAIESIVQQPIATLVGEFPDLEGLEPAASQEELPFMLVKLGENVAMMYQNFSNTASRERVRQELLKKNGEAGLWQEKEFQYLYLHLERPEALGVEEHRDHPRLIRSDLQEDPDRFMLTSGFVYAPFPFHPRFQPGSSFRYLGRQHMDGREFLVIAFAQRPDAKGLTCKFKTQEGSVQARIQGLAWVDPDNYQILRMRTDLLRPAPKIRLARVTTDIRFSEVRFNQLGAGEWLPHSVVVNVEWAGKSYRNLHEYSDFQLFTVETKDSRK